MSNLRIIRTIHVGVGGRGTWPIDLLTSDQRFQPVALVDVNQEFLEQTRGITGLGIEACFTRLEEALAAVPADAVIICTPTATHGPLSRLAFQAGKHVLVEKGMTTTWEDACALVKEAEAAGVKFCVSQNYRYRGEVQTLKQAITSGRYGSPYLIDLFHHRYRPAPRTLNYPYAMVWDMSVHHLDFLVSCFGPVAEATAVTYNAPWSRYPYDAGVSAILCFAAGPVCTYLVTHQATVNDYHFKVQSEGGALRWTGKAWEWIPALGGDAFGKNGPPEPVPAAPAPVRSEEGVINDFYRYITEGEEPGISGRNNLHTLRACEMVCRSAASRRTVRAEEVSGP